MAADGEKIANNGPTLAVDHVIVMEIGKAPVVMENANAKDLAGAGSSDLKERRRTVSKSKALLFALRCFSVLYAAATSLALWSVAGDDPQTVVWVFSTLTSAYLTISTIILTKTIPTQTVFVTVSYIALLAAAVAHLSSRIGMVIMHLDMAYAAGLFGYALAEHRQFTGADNCTAELIPMATMPSSSLTDDDKLQQEEADDTGCKCFCAATVSLLCAAGAASVLCLTKDTFLLVVEISFLVDLSVYCWTCVMTLHFLRCVLVQVTHMTLIYLLGPSLLVLLNMVVFYFFGMAIGTLVHSFAMIGMTGFFGYSLGVYAHYKHLVMLMSMEVSNKLPL